MTFSTGTGWEAQRKDHLMMGTHLHRCTECGQLSYDPRTGECDTEGAA